MLSDRIGNNELVLSSPRTDLKLGVSKATLTIRHTSSTSYSKITSFAAILGE
jgi:hypothetical protein